MKSLDPVSLTIFANRLSAICDEMGAQLCKAAFSPNIRDRLDFSCAVFDPRGLLCAQAAHIPVHLGSMAYAMQDIVGQFEWAEGDMVILNNPYKGGTHLPDVTLVAPVFWQKRLLGFVANRAHHADIGADSPGSMPVSASLDEEGIVIDPVLLHRAGVLQQDWFDGFLARLRHPEQARGDFSAQISANLRGIQRLQALLAGLDGVEHFWAHLEALNDYAERLAQSVLKQIPDGEYHYEDRMDSDGQGQSNVPIVLKLTVQDGRVEADFEGTADQVAGNINCPLSVAAAAVFYVFRCLMPDSTPACAGAFRSIELKAPEGCLLNAGAPAAVAAGNVETSTRVVDVVMGALAQAIPEKIPAFSHGSMNNLAMGSADQPAWDYYETIGGGMGAGGQWPGLSAVQTHMTNTLNTPIEVLEVNYPIRITAYQVRLASGGAGQQRGGDGVIREYEFTRPASVTLLTERRSIAPAGAAGGEPGATGRNLLNGELLADKVSLTVDAGDRIRVETPGGGGYGAA